MPTINLYFQVHQPFRLCEYTFFDIGSTTPYFNHELNQQIINKVCDKCYIPTNRLLLQLINDLKGNFKINFSFSGVFLEQLKLYRPDVLESFQSLIATGSVEVLSETYYHSLASLFDIEEFDIQVKQHRTLIKSLFNTEPKVFRNTELIFHQEIVKYCNENNYIGVLSEGTPQLLDTMSPNHAFALKGSNLKMLSRNFDLSDEIAYRFSDTQYELYPMTASKFRDLIVNQESSDHINLYMDYETFGEHQWRETQIFEFLDDFPRQILETTNYTFSTLSDTFENSKPKDIIDVNSVTSWADTEKDISAWYSNEMQKDALNLIYEVKEKIMSTADPEVIDMWRTLQTSDHFYYMSTKKQEDGDVHSYFSPYRSPYDAYLYYTNVLKDMTMKTTLR